MKLPSRKDINLFCRVFRLVIHDDIEMLRHAGIKKLIIMAVVVSGLFYISYLAHSWMF